MRLRWFLRHCGAGSRTGAGCSSSTTPMSPRTSATATRMVPARADHLPKHGWEAAVATVAIDVFSRAESMEFLTRKEPISAGTADRMWLMRCIRSGQ